MVNENIASVLKACVRGRINIIVSGRAEAGKTAMLNALCQHINPLEDPRPYGLRDTERKIVVEEEQELHLPFDHVIRLQAGSLNWRGEREFTQRLLVQKALRMLPDRIIVGDCNGPEAFDLISAIGTKSYGCMMSVTANTPYDCLQRLENMMISGQPGLTSTIARHLIAETHPVIVQISRLEDGTRRVTEIAELQGINDSNWRDWREHRSNEIRSRQDVGKGDYLLSTIFHLEREGRDPRGFYKIKFVGSRQRPAFSDQLENEAVPFKLEWLRTDNEAKGLTV